MDWETITKVVLALVGIITAGSRFYDIFLGKKTKLREEYEFAKNFLDDTNKKSLHPFALTKGYQAIAGSDAVNSLEIKYILSLKDPSLCLKDFILSKQLFERLQTEGDFKLVFKRKYSSSISRSWRKVWFLTLYIVLAFSALSPILLSNIVDFSFAKLLLLLAFTLPFFGLYAWVALKAYGKLTRGEFLFNNQNQHTSNIVVGSSNGKKVA